MPAAAEIRPLVARADAGPQIGWGHAVRTAHLVRALASAMGQPAWLLTRALPEMLANRLTALNIKVVDVAMVSDIEALDRLYKDTRPTLIIRDHYDLDATWNQHAKAHGTPLMVMEDRASVFHSCDIYLNPAARHDSAGHPRQTDAGLVLAGPEHALIDPCFREARGASAGQQKGDRLNVMIAFGGTDASGSAAGIAQKLAEANITGLQMHMPSAPNGPAYPTLTRYPVLPPKTLANLMAQCDLYVGAASTMALEAASTGLAIAAFPIAENQLMIWQRMQDMGVLYPQAPVQPIQTADAHNAWGTQLVQSLKRASRAKELDASAEAARHFCDGKGVERVTRAVQTFLRSR